MVTKRIGESDESFRRRINQGYKRRKKQKKLARDNAASALLALRPGSSILPQPAPRTSLPFLGPYSLLVKSNDEDDESSVQPTAEDTLALRQPAPPMTDEMKLALTTTFYSNYKFATPPSRYPSSAQIYYQYVESQVPTSTTTTNTIISPHAAMTFLAKLQGTVRVLLGFC